LPFDIADAAGSTAGVETGPRPIWWCECSQFVGRRQTVNEKPD